MEQYKDLQIFLVRKFFKFIIFISLAEYGIIVILNHTLIPFVMHSFFKDAEVEIVGIGGLIFMLFAILSNITVGLVRMILPDQLMFLSNAFPGLLTGNINMGEGTRLSDMTTAQEGLLALIILTALIIIAIPYIIGAILYSRIVTIQVRGIEEEEKSRLREYDEQKNLMLSDIAHDLRTPMTTVAGYSRALSDGMVPENKKEEYLSAIQAKADRMNNLINLLFDYVRLDSKGFQLVRGDLDICELVREVVTSEYQDIEDAGMELDIDIPENVIKVSADRVQLSRVITNLITNAIKHNESGTSIGIYVIEDDDYIRIMVADNGKPIPEDKAETIFDAFVMGDESRSSRGGSGLGLSIARKVVEMHGWNIRLVQRPMIRKYPEAASYSKMFMISIPM